MTKTLKESLNKRKAGIAPGSGEEMKEANREVKCEIKKDKLIHKKRAKAQFSTGRIRSAWRGFKSMAGLWSNTMLVQNVTLNMEKWTDNGSFIKWTIIANNRNFSVVLILFHFHFFSTLFNILSLFKFFKEVFTFFCCC